MRLIINGEERDVSSCATLNELVKVLDIQAPHFAVAVNLEVISKSNYESTRLNEGDKVEIVHAVGGGTR